MAQLVTGNLKASLLRVVFHAVLDTANIKWLASKAALVDQKQPFGPREGSDLQIGQKRLIGVFAQINHPLFGALAMVDKHLGAL